MILSNIRGKLAEQSNWGKRMLVSSFGYLNKNTGILNGIRQDNKIQSDPVVNQGLVSDTKSQNKSLQTELKQVSNAKRLDVIA